jgi:hypothetical protein
MKMKKIISFTMIMLVAIPAAAVTVTCVNEGNNIVRIDYDATNETVLPRAFGLNITVDNGAIIERVFDYKVGDSNSARPGFGIFPGAIKFDETGQIIDWGKPDVNDGSLGTLPGTGTSGVTLLMASRYNGSENAPRIKDTLCRILVDTGIAQIVNVQIAPNLRSGGIVLENASIAQFTGIGCTINSITPPPEPTPPPKPISISYPTNSDTGQYTVSWLASQGATSYQLERSDDGGITWSELYSGPETSYSEKVSNGNYRYRADAQNSIGVSDWITGSWDCVVDISTSPASPDAPVSIDYPRRSDTGKYTVSWSASANSSAYSLERSEDNGRTWSQIYSGSDTSYNEEVGDGRYYYRVSASNTAGSSNWTTGNQDCRVNINTRNGPSAPDSISYPASSSTGRYTVSWTSSKGTASYQLERSGNEGSDPWILVYSGTSASWPENITDGKYYYRVRAVANNGSYSSWTTGSNYCEVQIVSGHDDDHINNDLGYGDTERDD